MDFADELARLDLLLHREILRLRAGYQLSLDELRGIYISDDQVDALVARSHPPGAPDSIDELTAAAEELRRRIGDASPLAPVAARLQLTPFERDALLVVLAPELHLKYEALYGYLNNAAARRHATVDLVLRLCGGERAQLHASARLLRDGLLELVDSPSERRSELAHELVVAPPLAAALLGLPPLDPRLTSWVQPAADRPSAQVPLGPAVEDALAALARRLQPLAEKPIVILTGDPAQAPEAAARQLLRGLGCDLLRVSGAESVTALALMAQLRNDGVFVEVEEWRPETRPQIAGLVTALSRARVPVVLAVASASEWRSLVNNLPALTLALDEPEVNERRLMWSRALASQGLAEAAVSDVAEQFRLGPAQIAGAARALSLSGDEAEDPRRRLFAAAREQSSHDLGHLALRVPMRHAWSDLVLPPSLMRRLREVKGAVDKRVRVFGDWGFGRRGGSGLMVLFAGSSGTGKTMSASVIAREIGLELYRIELASVVSKYIGETEKNLHRIFEGARRANVMLFFDEADALLGRRSEVKDAHDRYANIEVAYLLQKMEEHDGVVILASNLSKNMDQAFSRRMHYVVEFPRPDAPLRERLWQRVLPPEVPTAGDLDFAFLARQFDLAGGDIKTVALDAAFLAAGENRAVAMADLVGAVARQLTKQGRPAGASDFKQYHRTVER